MSLPILANNTALPPMPFWQARSFWLNLLLVLTMAANAFGVDFAGVLRDLGLGATPDEVADTIGRVVQAIQTIAPVILGPWAWLERRAPHYRLTIGRTRVEPITAATAGE